MNRIALMIAVTACLTGTALAQQRAGGNGHARDANQRVGSGGINTPEGQIDYRVRNDMVTGDVAAGRGLQIDQPYRAANEFGDALGSDDLFDFRARSLPSAPTQLNAVQAPINLGGTPSVYRSYSTAPTTTGGPINYRVAPQGGYVTSDQLAGREPIITGGIVPQPQVFQPDQVFTGRPVDLATPLLGLRAQDLQAVQPDRPAPGVEGGAAIDEAQQPLDSRQDTRLQLPEYRPLLSEPTADDPLQSTPTQQDDDASDRGSMLSPTMLMGMQLQSRLGSERADRIDPTVAQRINRLGESLLNQAQNQAQDADSPYANVLQAVREGQTDQQAEESAPSRRAPIDLGAIDETQTQQAERQRAEALRRAFGQGESQDQADDAQQGETDESTARPGYVDPLAGLLDRLNYDLPALDTLAGDQATQTNQIMKQAEGALASGQYFDSERLYRQVVQRSDNPMARVGLVHAQLGAGMIRSAALNLRSLFEQHPEMIAARYQANLLPSQDRLRWVRTELEESLESGHTGSEPALLLAYLGYQVESRQLVRYGLATAEARAPRDPLMPVLRHIWLDQTDNSSNSAE